MWRAFILQYSAHCHILICPSRVRGWWVKGQRRSPVLRIVRALQKTDRQSEGNRQGGGSSHLTPRRETQPRRSAPDNLNTRDMIRFQFHQTPLFSLSCCAEVFYIDVRHVGLTHPSSDEEQGLAHSRWSRAMTHLGLHEGAANRAGCWIDPTPKS